MKNVVFITNGIYELGDGRSIASYGYCKEFSKYVNLKVFCPLPDSKNAQNEKKENLDIEFCREQRNTFFKKVCQLPELMIAKKTTLIEPSKPNTYRRIYEYLKHNDVDFVIIDHLALARTFFRLKRDFPKLKVVYNSHNAEGVNYYQLLTGKDYDLSKPELNRAEFRTLIDYIKCKYVFHIEKRVLNEADYSIAISKNDREVLCKQYDVLETKILHTRPLAKFELVKTEDELKDFHHNLLIVGSMGWYPNVRGILWFIDNVFSELIKISPEYTLYIVGRGPIQELKDAAALYPENIVLTGEVESTKPYFQMCDISIVPVFEGTGIKIKVLESMARGIPTICSSFAAKDYDTTGEIIVAETAEEFLNGIRQLKGSAALRENCYVKMKSFCNEYYNLTSDMKELFGV